MTKTYFSIISSETEEEVHGYVENGNIVYEDPLFGIYWTNEFPLTKGQLHDAVQDFELTSFTCGFGANDFGVFDFEGFTFIVNPQGVTETLLNTLIHMGIGYDDCAWTGSLPRVSVSDLLQKLGTSWTKYTKVSQQMAYVRWSVNGLTNHRLMKINYGDSQIADAVESAIKRIDGMTFNDKTCGDE